MGNMPPIELPPENPPDLLRLDRSRPVAVCLWTGSEHGEPHGGEPDVRIFHSGTSSTSVSAIVVVNEPMFDSASNVIIENMRFDRQPVIRITPADYGRS